MLPNAMRTVSTWFDNGHLPGLDGASYFCFIKLNCHVRKQQNQQSDLKKITLFNMQQLQDLQFNYGKWNSASNANRS
jgi:hypothetical protein